MSENPPFELTSESPADREALRKYNNSLTREAKAKTREVRRQEGFVERTFELHKSIVDQIDAVAKEHGFKKRDPLLSELITEGLRPTALKRILSKTRDMRNKT